MANEIDIQKQVERELKIDACTYICPVTGDIWKSDANTAMMSNALMYSPDKNLSQVLEIVSEGYRLSALEEVKYIAQESARLKAAGANPRDVLNDPMFERFTVGNPYKWQHTGILLMPSNGACDFIEYIEKDKQGRTYSRIDIYFRSKVNEGAVKDKKIAEGALMPHGKGVKVLECNPVLGIPSVISSGNDQHVMHSYFDPSLKEIEVALNGGWCGFGGGGCLYFDACVGPSFSGSGAAFRAVQGSVDDVIAPVFELFVKDRKSYEKGIITGRKEGLEEGRKLGRQEALTEFLADINDTLKKYTSQ